MTHLAFIQDDVIEGERRARQIAVERQKGCDRSCRPVEPRQRDMRDEGARFGIDADARQQLIDFAMQGRQRRRGFDPGPDGVRPPLAFEHAHPGDPRGDRGGVERAERGGNIFGAVAIDFADEA